MWFAILSMLFYLSSVLLITPMLLKIQAGEPASSPNKILFFATALIAISLHFVNLIPLFNNLTSGQNFTVMEISSLISVITASLATFALFFHVRTLWFLLPIIYSFTIINLILTTLLPTHFMYHLSQNIALFFHVGLSLFTYSICLMTALYSIQLLWIDNSLKNKKLVFSPIIPPLMTVERHFFRLMLTGEILLTIVLISGSFHLAKDFAPQDIQKAVFSFLAWLAFAFGLIGHWRLHWRGKKIVIYAMLGLILLSIAYFGSRVMLEI
ncbi:cytochrome c biogenesis protein CcsA [Pasteurella canis]|uniref:cytochrome C assembly family protein n=1 Tax=Pasteurella canis TaxID=753 RepID=UPI001D10B223|nr:cytochrome c biogenesis protein CcsA [Pasteurella canis]UDW83777.1 cytochrome c biogenesis protein CcsA [Pasteurella canis]